MQIRRRRKIYIMLAGTIVVTALLAGFSFVLSRHPEKNTAPQKRSQLSSIPQSKVIHTKILSKAAVDDLINRAANAKYIEDVLNTQPTLPLSSPPRLKPYKKMSYSAEPPVMPQITTKKENAIINAQRCTYNGQSYVPGDIVKTDQGWLRCSSTVIFSSSRTTTSESGKPAWTAVQ